MQFSTMNFDKAVLQIFRRLCIAPGSSLRHAMVVKEWSEMSLRRRDLDGTLKRLYAMCYLRQEKTLEGDMLELTPVGHEYMLQLFEHPLKNMLLQARLKWHALTRHPAGPTEARPEPRRRLTDRIAPTLPS